jgi:hypothetical protein
MKRMSFDEFSKRIKEVAKARKIFIPSFTNNISVAFDLYQEVLAEEKMEVFITTAMGGNRPLEPMDDFETPRCPECQSSMRLRIVPKDINGKEWPTSWYCTACLSEYYSEKSIIDWMKELKTNVQEQ